MFRCIPFILAAFSLQLLSSCADPHYAEIENPTLGRAASDSQSADCSIQFKNSKLCLSWFWLTLPSSETPGGLAFKTYRLNLLDRSPILVDLPAEVHVILWMPDMGHGSSPVQVERVDVGTYRATQVLFIMPGSWEIHFQSRQESSVIDEAIVSWSL